MLRRVRAADAWIVLDHFYYASSDESWEHSFDENWIPFLVCCLSSSQTTYNNVSKSTAALSTFSLYLCVIKSFLRRTF